MRYIDSGYRDAANALGTWFRDELDTNVKEFRCQTGFFGADALGLLVPMLDHLREANGLTRFVIGSNEPGTPAGDVRQLVRMLGLPRSNGAVGVVSYDAGYFHPKTYHLRRADGSQAAYVGSANFGTPGVGGKHVEAGLILDSRSGDSVPVLDQIGQAVDAWFTDGRPGFESVLDPAAVERLLAAHVLLANRPARQSSGRRTAAAQSGSARHRNSRLITIPRLPSPPRPASVPVATPVSPPLPPRAATMAALRWCKQLPSSDAQWVSPGTNPTGKLRLTKARHVIEHETYFRDDFFGRANWQTMTRRGNEMDVAVIPFDVTIRGVHLGRVDLTIDHSPHRARVEQSVGRSSERHNVPTILAWGRQIISILSATAHVNDWVLIERSPSGAFSLTIQQARPAWAP
jgi:hypothetical protein